MLADDATPEYLVSLMAANGGRIAIMSDEGGIFDILAGRYSGTPNLHPYLKGHAGRPIDTGRQTRAGAYVSKPALTVGVMAQPVVLRSFGGNADLAGRGLPARFLFALPKSLAGYRQVDADPIPATVTTRYDRRVHDLAATLAEWEDPAVVALADAQRVRIAAAADIIDAALAIPRDEGLHKVTIRRVALALDTGPASLYVLSCAGAGWPHGRRAAVGQRGAQPGPGPVDRAVP